MKRVLLLAYYFAPRNHIASLRTGCFAKYLLEHGWLPTVVCDHWGPENPDYNPGINGHFPDIINVHRILAGRESRVLTRFFRRKIGPYLWPEKCPYAWWIMAMRKVDELLRTEKYDAVWATSDPLLPLALGQYCNVKKGIPWVADVRDSFDQLPFGSWYRRPFSARAERNLCKAASAVVTVSDGLASGLARKLRRPVHVIMNGFDPDLLPADPYPVDTEKFVLLYSGNITPGQQHPQVLIDALSLCFSGGGIPRDKIKLLFFGTRLCDLKKCLKSGISETFVEILPSVSHNELLRLQKSAAVLVSFTHPGASGVPTTKIFDYLAAKRPILAVPDDQGAVRQLLAETGAGVSHSSPDSIADTLMDWYKKWLANRSFELNYNETSIYRYSRRYQTKQLALLLDSLITAPNGRH